ncbi:MAG: efflux RND transporter permease subunit [Xanthomonadales bacterium]|nr:efflux RND transporter permease subunit [Xanthomonadales bacterium]
MITRLIDWSLHNQVLVLLLSALLGAAGLWAVRSLPVDALPDLSDVQVIVKTPFPGQAPQVVEDQVTYPLSTALLSVPGAITVRGYSFFGDSYCYVIFADGTDLYWARARVLEYLNQAAAELPAGVRPALGPDATGVGWIYQYALVDRSGQHDLAQLRSLQDWFLKYELQALPGVAEVASLGGMVRQYQVIVDPDRLRAYGLSLAQVHHAIASGNQERGGAVIEMGEAEYMVRATGYLSGLEDLAALPLGLSAQGTPLRLEDVAELRVGPELRRGIGELDGEGEVAGGIVLMRSGDNALATIERVRARLAELQASLPPGVELVTTYDRAGLIKRAINTLQETLLKELLVVGLICAVFLLHLRSALVVLITLPLGVLAAFLIMRLQGINANIMSLGGIAIAIGAMVDAAIVMLENAHRHLAAANKQAPARRAAIARAVREVGPPIFFSLLIITLSFIPVFALEAQEGRLFAPLAWTKTWAMAAAAGLAVTLLPVLIMLCLGQRPPRVRRNPFDRLLRAAYAPLLKGVLRRPGLIVLLALLLLPLGLWPAQKLGSEFMPELEEGDLLYMPSTYPGISPDKARELLQQTNKLIMSVPEVAQVHGKIGRADTATDPAPLSMIESLIRFHPPAQWRPGMTRERLREELDQVVQLPGLTNSWVMPIKARIDMLATGIRTPVGIKVSGPDLKELTALATRLEALLQTLPDTRSVYAERVSGGRYLVVDIDRQRAARYGLNIDELQQLIAFGIGGANITRTVEGRERYPVSLRFPQTRRDSLQALEQLPLLGANGASLALADVATLRIEDGPPMIRSENARLTGWVYVDTDTQDLSGYVQAAQQLVAEQLSLPPGYALSWSGQYEYLQRAQQRLLLVAPLTLAIMVLLLYLSFRSLPEVALVLGTLPLALSGGLWLLYLLDYSLSVAVGVGFLALAGVSVELGVVMLVYLNQAVADRRRETQTALDEASLREAVRRGALLRVRPVIMTVAATIAGLLPIMLGTGTGAEIMRRIAAPMVGGLLSATLLALAVIPAIYLLWQRSRLRD